MYHVVNLWTEEQAIRLISVIKSDFEEIAQYKMVEKVSPHWAIYLKSKNILSPTLESFINGFEAACELLAKQ